MASAGEIETSGVDVKPLDVTRNVNDSELLCGCLGEGESRLSAEPIPGFKQALS